MSDFKKKRGKRRKVCKLCIDRIRVVDYKDTNRLSKFVTERGKIIPRRISGNCANHQRQISVAIKNSRVVALLPYTVEA